MLYAQQSGTSRKHLRALYHIEVPFRLFCVIKFNSRDMELCSGGSGIYSRLQYCVF